MPEALEVTLPLLNPNEPEALLAALHVQNGEAVHSGQALCTLETTKSAADVEAAQDGYVAGLRLQAGQTVHAGDRLCYLAPTPDWQPAAEPDVPEAAVRTAGDENETPPGLRITQPALALARRLGLNLQRLPVGPLVTEAQVRSLASTSASEPAPELPITVFDPTAILIYGGGGHGKMVIDLLRARGGYRIAGIVDDGLPAGSPPILGVPVLGGSEVLAGLYTEGVRLAVNAVGGIGRVAVRMRVSQRLAEAGFGLPVLIHPSAVVEPSATLEAGAQIMARAYVGSAAHVGPNCIVNTGAIISHDCQLEAFATISPGAILAGAVEVGSGALVGMGATINLQARLGAGALVGNGATVKSHVPEKGVVPAGTIWPRS